MSNTIVKEFNLEGTDSLLLCGVNDRNLKIIESNFDVLLIARGDVIKISGNSEQVGLVENLLSELVFMINSNNKLSRSDLMTAVNVIKGEAAGESLSAKSKDELDSVVLFTPHGYVKPNTSGQIEYVKSVEENDIVFCIGPAGTGKTYLAVAMAVSYLNKNELVK